MRYEQRSSDPLFDHEMVIGRALEDSGSGAGAKPVTDKPLSLATGSSGVGSVSGSSAFVVVQTAEFGNLDYFTVGARLYSSGLRGVFAQRFMLESSGVQGVQPIQLSPRSPNLNAFAERGVRSIKDECLSKLILFGEASLRRTATDAARWVQLIAGTLGWIGVCKYRRDPYGRTPLAAIL